MKKVTIMMVALWVAGTLSAADVARLALDCREGVKMAGSAELISYSPNWATEESGAEAVVTVDGQEVVRSTEAGAYEWVPDHRIGPRTLTHRVELNGETVGEVYEASFYEAAEIKIDSASLSTPWDPSLELVYTIPYATDDFTRQLSAEYLRDNEWVRLPEHALSGDVSTEVGTHRVTVDLDGVKIPSGELKIRLVDSARFSGYDVKASDEWRLDPTVRYDGLASYKSSSQTASLVVEVCGRSSLNIAVSSGSGFNGGADFYVDGAYRGDYGFYCNYPLECWTEMCLWLPNDVELHTCEFRFYWYDMWDGEDSLYLAFLDDPGIKVDDAVAETTLTVPSPTLSLWPEIRGAKIALVADQPNVTIYYTLDGSKPTTESHVYSTPLTAEQYRNVRAFAYLDENHWSAVLKSGEYAFDIAESMGGGISNVETSDDSVFSDIPGEVVLPIELEEDNGWGYGYSFTPKNFAFDVDGEAVLSFEAEIDLPEPTSGNSVAFAQAPIFVTLDGVDVNSMNHGVSHPEDTWLSGMRYPAGLNFLEGDRGKYVWKLYLKPGQHRVSIGYSYAMLSGASSAEVRIKNIKVHPVVAPDDLFDFGKQVYEFGIWQPGGLAHLKDVVYGTRIAANGEDYEARVMRAITKVLLLCENETVWQVLADFGFSIDDYTLALTGESIALEAMPLPNETIDRVAPAILAGLDDALSDLKVIPDNWNGCIVLDPNVYTFIPEACVIDLAEISVFRALVEAARASVLLAQGYDFTMDYVAVSNAVRAATHVQEVMAAAPQAGYVRDAQALLEAKEWFRTALNHIRRADQVVLWRTSPCLHLIEYDRADEADIGRARLYLSHLIGSLDHPETIDLPYFVDRFGGVDETLPGGMFRQIYLGALFAGRVTRDVVPEVMISPTTLYMDTVEDVTVGGLLPDLSFGEFADLYPLNQYWTMDLYRAIQPKTRLVRGQSLTVEGEAACDGTLEYVAYGTGLKSVFVTCSVADELIDEHTFMAAKKEGLDQKSFESCVQVSANDPYTLTCFATAAMNRRLTLFDILTIPEFSPYVDGNYTETIDGITWLFTVENGEATITGVQGTVSGDIVVPAKLGGRPVTAIADQVFALKSQIASVVIPSTVASIGKYAFMACENLTSIRFEGDSPEVGTLAFTGVASTAKVVFTEGATVSGATNGLWHGLTVEYATVEKTDYLRVRASLPDGYSFTGTATLSLAADADATIYFTMNGEDPTAKALVYSSPISVASTTCVKYFAIDNSTGALGPVGITVLKLVAPEIEFLEAEPYVKNVNGITWSYLKRADGVCLSGTAGFASGKPLTGVIELPTSIDWQPVVSVGAGLFSGCDQLTGVVIPQGITTIEREAFRGCTRLETVELPEGLLTIGDSAFERCTSLVQVTIPDSVTEIGYFAFRDCLRLEEVKLEGSGVPTQDLGVYIGVPAFTIISGRLGSATAIVYASVTNKTDEITVPEGWLAEIAARHDKPAGSASYEEAFKAKFGDDLAAALVKPTGKHDLKGNALMVWQDYVAGTNPLDEEDVFTATLTMENGLPVVKWTPELPPAQAASRKYTTYGSTSLSGKWTDVSDLTPQQRKELGYQFFTVTVEMK